MVATRAAQGWQAFLSSAALSRDSVGSRLKAVEAVRSHSVGRSCTLERQGGIQTALHGQRILSSQYSCHQRYSLVESPSQWLLQQRRHCHHNQSTVLLSAFSFVAAKVLMVALHLSSDCSSSSFRLVSLDTLCVPLLCLVVALSSHDSDGSFVFSTAQPEGVSPTQPAQWQQKKRLRHLKSQW